VYCELFVNNFFWIKELELGLEQGYTCNCFSIPIEKQFFRMITIEFIFWIGNKVLKSSVDVILGLVILHFLLSK